MEEVVQFEKGYTYSAGTSKRRSRRAENHSEQRMQKRRARTTGNEDPADDPTGPSHPGVVPDSDARSWHNQQGAVEEDTEEERSNRGYGRDEEMRDAEPPFPERGMHENGRCSDRMDIRASNGFQEAPSNGQGSSQSSIFGSNQRSKGRMGNSVKEPPLVQSSISDRPRLNFHQVYKQKRKLEENWDAGRYKSFQLPHRDHPEEAHIECVYTIQYGGKYLVSGSRDRTLRIWDLETQRLVRRPLTGHTGSVLCLQFDDSEQEDIIISGSSDTDVILWQFSTGQLIKKIPHAHRESVLNLKFDSRFLVTCSKDKTIKIWNRHELRPGDENYPVRGVSGGGKCPAYIVDLSSYASPLEIEQHLSPKQKQPLAKYNTIMTLDTHGAAVNAIHIYKDQLVSASGDRSLKVWNIHTGVCTAMCMGHTKGIACVQYDGKRIVSGSSDNTIRIFDPHTQAEVACLQGHIKLVRTIQAAFSDPRGTVEDLEEEARAVDRMYFEARRSGAIPSSSARIHRNRDRNAGSRMPGEIMAYGAKIPPGGGGNRWSRIVSGSYDETVIIWKKAPDGRWVVSHKLRQAEALRAAGGPLIAQSELQHQAQQQAIGQQQHPYGPLVLPHNVPQQQGANTFPPSTHNPPHLQHPIPAHQLVQHAMQTGAAALQTGMNNLAAINHQLGNNAHMPNHHPYFYQGATNPHMLQQQLHAQQQAQAQMLQHQHQHLQQQQQVIQHLQQQHLQQQQNGAQPAAQGPNQNPTLVAPPVSQPNARVFKLQFDARRIICCSQDPKIVGWDFANEDEGIIECSRFFGAPT